MTKEEFKQFCHNEFVRRGFVKRKSMYYLKGKDLLCGLYLQKSMAEAFYVEYDYFLDEYEDIKKYPNHYDADIWGHICVMSKDTIKGEHFMDGLIEYERYTDEEIIPYFEETFQKYILPPLEKGKRIILENPSYYLESVFPKEKEKVLQKLKE